MKPRDSLGPTDADRYDETYDFGEDSDSDIDTSKADDDKLKLKLDIEGKGLSDEQILKYSVRQKLYPSSYVLIRFKALTVMGFTV